MTSEDKPTRNYQKVLEAEYSRINVSRGLSADNKKPDCIVGLALSGGGVRSATFNLGLLQAMARYKVLNGVDYLSTVSGGGYIGSSLTWLLDRLDEDFPFGTSRKHNKEKPGQIVGWIRRHGEYLIPGDGLDKWALGAAVLRGSITNILFILPAFFVLIYALGAPLPWPELGQLDPIISKLEIVINSLMDMFSIQLRDGWLSAAPNTLFHYAFVLSLIMFVLLPIIFFLMALVSKWSAFQAFSLRRRFQTIMGRYLFWGVMTFIIASIPFALIELDTVVPDEDSTFIMKILLSKGAVLSYASIAGLLSIYASWRRRGKIKETKGTVQLAMILGLSLLAYGLALWFHNGAESLRSNDTNYEYPIIAACVLVPLTILLFANINHVSMHKYYRDRLLEAYLPPFANDADLLPPTPDFSESNSFLLHKIPPKQRPYHIINTNMVVPNARTPKLRARGGENFIFSPLFCGSDSTEYVDTSLYLNGKIDLATAMAISGAAVDPNTGTTRSLSLSFFMTLVNARLGYWIKNPRWALTEFRQVYKRRYNEVSSEEFDPEDSWTQKNLENTKNRTSAFRSAATSSVKRLFPSYGVVIRELFARQMTEMDSWIHLSDGGHFENLALYELVRRKCSVIIVSDAGADPDWKFADLARACELVRVDFCADITINTMPLQPNKKDDISEIPYVIGEITYEDNTKGILLYIKTTIVPDLPEDIYGYKRENSDFPDQTTTDQFFREQQFEAYRELGFQLGRLAFREYPEDSQSTACEGLKKYLNDLSEKLDAERGDKAKGDKDNRENPV